LRIYNKREEDKKIRREGEKERIRNKRRKVLIDSGQQE
jgi:hypothetical protein